MDERPDTLDRSEWITRRISSGRYSVGPIGVSGGSYVSFRKRVTKFMSLVCSVFGRILRESSSICAFALLTVWIAYFVGVLSKDLLLVSNGVLISMIVVSALLRRRNMRTSQMVRRPFPQGAIIRSGSDPGVTAEDLAVVDRIRQLFIAKVIAESKCERPLMLPAAASACVICLIDFDEEDNLVSLPCEHSFHSLCLIDWFQAQLSASSSEVVPSCPICRKQLVLSEEALNGFVRQVCEPGFLAPDLSHRVHVVFHPRQS